MKAVYLLLFINLIPALVGHYRSRIFHFLCIVVHIYGP